MIAAIDEERFAGQMTAAERADRKSDLFGPTPLGLDGDLSLAQGCRMRVPREQDVEHQ